MSVEVLKVAFDYGALDPVARALVWQRTGAIRALMHRASADIVEIGCALVEVKAHLPKGQFHEWLTAEFAWTIRTAQVYILVAAYSRRERNAHLLPPQVLYMLSAPSMPEDVAAGIAGRAAAGETITATTVNAAVRADALDLDSAAEEAFAALSGRQQAQLTRAEQDTALEAASVLLRPSERERRLARVEEHAGKALNAAVALGEEGAELAAQLRGVLAEREKLAAQLAE